jgi:hypothetical protein
VEGPLSLFAGECPFWLILWLSLGRVQPFFEVDPSNRLVGGMSEREKRIPFLADFGTSIYAKRTSQKAL